MDTRRKVIALVSGGMDSVTALYHTLEDPTLELRAVLSFDYGSKHNAREIPCAAHHAAIIGIPHLVIPLTFIKNHFKSALLQGGEDIPDGHYADDVMKQTVVPFRNGIMLSIAAGFAESVEASGIVIAAHAGDHAIYPDCRADFMESMRTAIGLGTYIHVGIIAPFQHLSKADIVQRASVLGVNLGQTWSCYKGRADHCGKCGTCIERREAFHLAGVKDPTKYEDSAPTLEELVACGFKYKEPVEMDKRIQD